MKDLNGVGTYASTAGMAIGGFGGFVNKPTTTTAAAPTPPPPSAITYRRPDGTSTYFRTDGTSLYVRPS